MASRRWGLCAAPQRRPCGQKKSLSLTLSPCCAVIVAQVLMEESLEKLKILDYEEEFCQTNNNDLLTRTQFAMPSANPAENFKTFAALVQWLMALNGNYTEQWDRFTDPNVTVTNMMNELRKVGINTDIPPHKLKQGHGGEVCQVLNSLVDITLQKKGFRFARPQHAPDAYAEDPPDEMEGPADDMGDEIGDNVQNAEEDEEEEMYVAAPSTGEYGGSEDKLESSMMESKVDPIQWRLELERVAPHLKLVIKSNSAKEWRSHLEQAVTLEKQIGEGLPKTQQTLSHIVEDVGDAIEKIQGRERVVNQNFDHMIAEYRKVKEALISHQEKYDNNSGTITKLTNELAEISEELDDIKGQMDSRGNSMTDTSPLILIKKALSRIKSEVKQMDLRIGAVEHTLLQVAKQSAKQTNTN
jgi:estrogen-related receptor beta like 1